VSDEWHTYQLSIVSYQSSVISHQLSLNQVLSSILTNVLLLPGNWFFVAHQNTAMVGNKKPLGLVILSKYLKILSEGT